MLMRRVPVPITVAVEEVVEVVEVDGVAAGGNFDSLKQVIREF